MLKKLILFGIPAIVMAIVAYVPIHLLTEQAEEESREYAETKKAEHAAKEKAASAQQVAKEKPEAPSERKHKRTSGEWWLVYVTVALTVFTSGLMVYTAMLWLTTQSMMERAEVTSKGHERAYIYGGGPYGDRKDGKPVDFILRFNDPADFKDEKRLTVQNYGRTPGHIFSVEYGFCDRASFPRNTTVSAMLDNKMFPDGMIQKVEYPSFVVPPSATSWLSYRPLGFKRSDHVGQVFFGRIRYTDVFKDKHYSTFKYHLNSAGYSDPIDDGLADEG